MFIVTEYAALNPPGYLLIILYELGKVETPSCNDFWDINVQICKEQKLKKMVLLTVPRRYFFCGPFMFLFCLVFAMFCARLFICALWSPAGKGLTPWLSFVLSLWVCHFPIGILGQVWYLIVSIPDLCTLTYFDLNFRQVIYSLSASLKLSAVIVFEISWLQNIIMTL